MERQDRPYSSDHDLLVRLDEKLDNLTSSFNEVRVAMANKADRVAVEKLDIRVSGMERHVHDISIKIASASGGLAVLQFLIHWLWK